MPWFGHQTIDPQELESRFSQEDSIAYLDSILSDEPSKESQELLERVKVIVDDLPAREADFINLYYFNHLKQTDIAEIFGVSQPTVCYRLQRAASRIQFLLDLPVLNIEDLERDLGGFLSDPLDVKIMVLMYQTTCQSEAAKQLGVSQGLVRHRFLRSLSRMEQNPELNDYYQIFVTVSKNLNILREVQRSSKNDVLMYSLS